MDEESSSEKLEFLYVKLTNGENILCCTRMGQEIGTYLEVVDPIQIVSFKMPFQGSILEKYIMQKWIPFCDANIVQIPVTSILFVGPLSQTFAERYLEYLESAPEDEFTPISDFEDSDDDMFEKEELVQEEQPVIEKPKKWLH